MTTKRAFITGAASGIGKAVATALHHQGWQLGLADINYEQLQSLVQNLIHNSAPSPQCFALDVSDAQAFSTVIETFCQSSPLDLLFNCAGVLTMGEFKDVSITDHHRTIDINLKGTINGCAAAFEYLKKAKGSHLINVSSASSNYGVPHLASYSASKFAVKGLTEALELEWAQYGITVCDIVPPFVNTQMLTDQSFTAPVMDALGVDLSPEEVAKTVIKALTKHRVHHPVGKLYSLLHTLSDLTLSPINRLIMKRLAKL